MTKIETVKKSRGRPRKKPEDKLTEAKVVYFPRFEFNRLRSTTDTLEMSANEFIRESVKFVLENNLTDLVKKNMAEEGKVNEK